MLKTSDLKKKPPTRVIRSEPPAPPAEPDPLAQMQAAMTQMAANMAEMAKAITVLTEKVANQAGQ